MDFHYTSIRNQQIVISLLKAKGIRKVIASPGTQNMSIVASMQQDSFFQMYSAADERSAAYMACGLSAESGEPVVLSCTGATASRNYIPGLTEAFYRHLPIVAITSTERTIMAGHNIAQVIDRSEIQKDVAKISVLARAVYNDDDAWDCMIQVNKALLELNHHGKGPVHINLEKVGGDDFSNKDLPSARNIERIMPNQNFPDLINKKVAVFVGSHQRWSDELSEAVDAFCGVYDAVVFCDQTSNYKGKYRVNFSLTASQIWYNSPLLNTDIIIHLGEVSGDYYQQGRLGRNTKEVWRVSEDGEIKDTFKKLKYVFEMSEQDFFEYYTAGKIENRQLYLEQCKVENERIYTKIPELPFGNIWIALQMFPSIPKNTIMHFGILNSLRSWNFVELPQSVLSYSNVGGFGIDGGVSALIGSSLAFKEKIHIGIFGDLAFFYDMNVLGNRHVGNNVRIMLINNAKGSEFRLYHHPASAFGDEADKYIAAGGHYGQKSPLLVKHYAEDLGFDYLTASNKDEFTSQYKKFLNPQITDKPILFEVFTEAQNESNALKIVNEIEKSKKNKHKDVIKKIIGEKTAHSVKRIIDKL